LIYLILAISCSALISIIMRIGTYKAKAKISMLAANYATCFIIAATTAGFDSLFPGNPALPKTLLMGIFNGFVYLSAFLLLQRNMRTNGVVLSTTFSKLGLLVPMLVSVLLFGEMPSLLQAAGFVIAIAAIILINPSDKEEKSSRVTGLVLLLIVCGTADAMNKVYNELGAAELSSQFLLYTFMSALVLCLMLMFYKKEKPGKYELIFGVLLGIPNYYSTGFVLRALTQLPAVIVYPTFSVGTILTVSLAGVLLFRERLKKQQWLALAIILVALALLNI